MRTPSQRDTSKPDATPGVGKLYGELASWWPLLSAPEDYQEEAAFFERQLLSACTGPARTLLELGSGGGNNAVHLKGRFEQTVLVDLSAEMLAVSRKLNPDCEHIAGDMRSVRLARAFDCVFVHDAIVYMTTESDLRLAMETAYVHCRPGGSAVFAPDHLRENFSEDTEHGGTGGAERSIRYLSWSWDPDPNDTHYLVEYAYLMRQPDGSVRVEHDRHVEGLFPRNVWMRLLSDVGFLPTVVPLEHSELEPGEVEIFVCKRPA